MGGILHRSLSCVACAALLALGAAGCKGGEVTTYRLTRDAGSLSSLASDGSILGGDTADGQTTAPYTRVHAGEVGKELGKLADVLESATPQPGLEDETARLVELAREASGLLEQLEDHPSAHALAAKVETRLSDISDTAEEIGKSA